MRDATENTVNNGSFRRLFKDAYSQSFTQDNIVAGFEATGIVAWNPLALPRDAFATPHNTTQKGAPEDAQPALSDTQRLCWVLRKVRSQNVDGQGPNVTTALQTQPEKVSTLPRLGLGSTDAVNLRQMVIEPIPSTSAATDTGHPLQAMPPEPILSTSSAPEVGPAQVARPHHGQFPLEMILPDGSHQIIMVECVEEEPVKPACPEDPWKSTVDKIFSAPTVNEKVQRPGPRKAKSRHRRVLTSDEIIQGKMKIMKRKSLKMKGKKNEKKSEGRGHWKRKKQTKKIKSTTVQCLVYCVTYISDTEGSNGIVCDQYSRWMHQNCVPDFYQEAMAMSTNQELAMFASSVICEVLLASSMHYQGV